MVIDFDHATTEEVALAYIRVTYANKGKIRAAVVRGGRIRCELHGGVVIEAESPEALEAILLVQKF